MMSAVPVFVYSALNWLQAHTACEKSFSDALSGVEMEDLRPNMTQIQPQLQLPW